MSSENPSDKSREGYYEHAREEVIALIPASARVVVDVGCGAGALGRHLKGARPGVQVRGIEIVPEQADRARNHLDDVTVGDAGAGLPAGWPKPDCVVFADVLEHLHDPWSTLRQWRSQVQERAHLVVSLPNVLHAGVVRPLVRGRWDYADEGVLDRTHLRFFTRLTAIELVEQSGFELVELRRVLDTSDMGGIGKLLRATRLFNHHEDLAHATRSGLRALASDLATRQFLLLARAR